MTGEKKDFKLYKEKDLPFLNAKTEMGAVMRKTIIDGDVDDDCATDEEQMDDAKFMLKNELANAINRFLDDKKDNTQHIFIKNLNYGSKTANKDISL